MTGSGGYADNGVGAITVTGHGECFAKIVASKHIAVLMEQGGNLLKSSCNSSIFLKE